MVRDFLIRKEIIESESLSRCSLSAAMAWRALLPVADNHGRFDASPRKLKLKMAPFHDEATEKVIQKWLDEYEREHMITRWQIDGNSYGEIVNYKKWNPGLRYTKSGSKFPRPEELEQANAKVEQQPSTRLPSDVLEALEGAMPGRVQAQHLQKVVVWLYGAQAYTAAEVVDALTLARDKKDPITYASTVLRNKRDQQTIDAEAPAKPAPRKPEKRVEWGS